MRLPGQLRATTLGDLLGSLHRGRATGILELIQNEGVNAGRQHRVHLSGGLVQQVETGACSLRLGEVLRAAGVIDEETLNWLATRVSAGSAKRCGQLLVEAQLVSGALVGAALRHQLRTRLETLFDLEEGLVRFHVACPHARRDARYGLLMPREFLYGRPRARDRRRSVGAGSPRTPDGPPAAAAARSGVVSGRLRALSILGLHESADRAAVRRAFRQLAATMHPDRHPGASSGQMAVLLREFARITAAYHELVA
jgi:DnaJ-domain-containing protein 1